MSEYKYLRDLLYKIVCDYVGSKQLANRLIYKYTVLSLLNEIIYFKVKNQDQTRPSKMLSRVLSSTAIRHPKLMLDRQYGSQRVRYVT